MTLGIEAVVLLLFAVLFLAVIVRIMVRIFGE
jgi:hypothetical protein